MLGKSKAGGLWVWETRGFPREGSLGQGPEGKGDMRRVLHRPGMESGERGPSCGWCTRAGAGMGVPLRQVYWVELRSDREDPL